MGMTRNAGWRSHKHVFFVVLGDVVGVLLISFLMEGWFFYSDSTAVIRRTDIITGCLNFLPMLFHFS
jgi:hypothetical protein